MKRIAVAQQGEVKVYKIDAVPVGIQTREPERNAHGRIPLTLLLFTAPNLVIESGRSFSRFAVP